MAVLLLALLLVTPKISKCTSADKHQRRINAETLQLVFQLLFEPLQAVVREGVNIDCADGKVWKCFPISSAWIADYMDYMALHGVKSNSCPKCKVLPWELGNNAKYSARYYTKYEYCQRENGFQSPRSDSDNADNTENANLTFDTFRIDMGPGVFHWLYRVLVPDLHVPDLLHNIYLRLFKHMMHWMHGFLKKGGQLEAFDDAWETLPLYPAFLVPKKAYREVTQWQRKEMRNLGRGLLGVLAMALRQPDSTKVIPFKRALESVRSVVDFNMIAQ